MAIKKYNDLLAQQDEIAKRRQFFILSPKHWAEYNDQTITKWDVVRLNKSQRSNVPRRPGIYTILVQPRIANHEACSYLMYVGKAVSLKKRFSNYVNAERRASGRPKLFRVLNLYEDYVWFAFADVPRPKLKVVENRLIAAHLPPCNDQFPAKVRKAVKAFN